MSKMHIINILRATQTIHLLWLALGAGAAAAALALKLLLEKQQQQLMFMVQGLTVRLTRSIGLG